MMAALFACVLAIIIGFASLHFFGSDNPIEEFTENIIEEITGIEDIDLSP